jgi:hypothetical protein
MFRRLLTQIDLQESLGLEVEAARFLVQKARNPGPVYGVKGVEDGHGGTHLVGLQRAEEMPFRVGRKLRGLDQGFLDPILAEAAESGTISCQKAIHGLPLPCTHEADGIRIPAGPMSGSFDSALHRAITTRDLGGGVACRRKSGHPGHLIS